MKTSRKFRLSKMTDYLSDQEKTDFLKELLSAFESNDWAAAKSCIDNWENIAELNSIPNVKNNVWAKFNRLKTEGKICL